MNVVNFVVFMFFGEFCVVFEVLEIYFVFGYDFEVRNGVGIFVGFVVLY